MTVEEEQRLLAVAESGDPDEMMRVIREVMGPDPSPAIQIPNIVDMMASTARVLAMAIRNQRERGVRP